MAADGAPRAAHRSERPRAHRAHLEEALQVLGQVEGGLVAAVPVLLDRGQEHDLEVARQERVQPARAVGLLVEDRAVQRLARRGLERAPQRQALEERRAQRIDVAAAVDCAALPGDLLG